MASSRARSADAVKARDASEGDLVGGLTAFEATPPLSNFQVAYIRPALSGYHSGPAIGPTPIAVLLAAYSPGVAPFAVGQAAFTVMVIVLFNILVPTGWKVGELRIEDVALGAAVDAILAGQKKTFKSLGVREGGVGAIALDESSIAASKCLIADHADVAAKMREVAGRIASGSLTLADPMAAR